MNKSTTEMLRGTLVNIKLDNSCSALWQETLLGKNYRWYGLNPKYINLGGLQLSSVNLESLENWKIPLFKLVDYSRFPTLLGKKKKW